MLLNIDWASTHLKWKKLYQDLFQNRCIPNEDLYKFPSKYKFLKFSFIKTLLQFQMISLRIPKKLVMMLLPHIKQMLDGCWWWNNGIANKVPNNAAICLPPSLPTASVASSHIVIKSWQMSGYKIKRRKKKNTQINSIRYSASIDIRNNGKFTFFDFVVKSSRVTRCCLQLPLLSVVLVLDVAVVQSSHQHHRKEDTY